LGFGVALSLLLGAGPAAVEGEAWPAGGAWVGGRRARIAFPWLQLVAFIGPFRALRGWKSARASPNSH